MKYHETSLPGAYVIELERRADERGFFARGWCRDEFAAQELCSRFVQCNFAFTDQSGTLRGLHYQVPPHAEAKLIRCTAGEVFDVIVDIRPESPTYLQYGGFRLSAENRSMLYVPEGFAHGYQALKDNTEILYLVSTPYHPGSERGVRWNDREINIQWPEPVTMISEKDSLIPDFCPCIVS